MSPKLEHYLKIISELAQIAQKLGLNSIKSELETRVRDLRDQQTQIVVLGEFNHGKSSLLNAILGKKVLSVGITPTTQHITRIFPGNDTDTAAYLDKTGTLHDIAFENWENLANEKTDVAEIHIHLATQPVVQGGVFIDTPGVNDISKQRMEVSYNIVPRAGLILFVLDASQVLKQSEVCFIEECMTSVPADRMIFVINKCDILDEEELQTVHDYATSRLGELLGNVTVMECCSRGRGQFGIEEIRNAIKTRIKAFGNNYIEHLAQKTIREYRHILSWYVQWEKSGTSLSENQIDAKIAEIQNKISSTKLHSNELPRQLEEKSSSIRIWMQHEVDQFESDFSQALLREIDKASAEDLEDYFADFIEEEFHSFTHDISLQIRQMLESLSEELFASLSSDFASLTQAIHPDLSLSFEAMAFSTEKSRFNASLLILGAVGFSAFLFINAITGSMIALSVPFVSHFLKNKLEDRVKERARKISTETVHNICAQLKTELENAIRNYAEELLPILRETGGNFYGFLEEILQSLKLHPIKSEELDVISNQLNAISPELQTTDK